jgi:hypothetical protein
MEMKECYTIKLSSLSCKSCLCLEDLALRMFHAGQYVQTEVTCMILCRPVSMYSLLRFIEWVTHACTVETIWYSTPRYAESKEPPTINSMLQFLTEESATRASTQSYPDPREHSAPIFPIAREQSTRLLHSCRAHSSVSSDQHNAE